MTQILNYINICTFYYIWFYKKAGGLGFINLTRLKETLL